MELTANGAPRLVSLVSAVIRRKSNWTFLAVVVVLFAFSRLDAAGQITPSQSALTSQQQVNLPPRVRQAQRFLARRGWRPGQRAARPAVRLAKYPQAQPQTTAPAVTWEPLGPTSVLSANYGLVSGRVTSLALDPADSTGNRLLVGTTGGGVWLAQNAATSNAANVVFTPLTDRLAAMSTGTQANGWPSTVVDPSISIGALTVQPGGTGVILAGTGDPNDALDSYYGAGVLRSGDGGKTWSLIQSTSDQMWSFTGEGFAGFAWSTLNPQVVVAAVSQAWEGTLVQAEWPHFSYQGLYYSTDSGVTWSLSRIVDLNGLDVQGPRDAYATPSGNAATSVVWNPLRKVFIAAVRFHGYYQSPDGVTWTRLAAQPGASLTTAMCPTNPTSTGSTACPIFRGTLAVNPFTGDTFAWTVDLNNQDQGIWQDVCTATGNVCTNQAIAFQKQWDTSALQSDTWLGSATIQNGDYNLALAAVPSNQDTLLMAGGNDLWKCSLAMGCVWRNTTNARTCMSAQVAQYQHALIWSETNPLEMFIGNDSGLWRSTDAIGETGPVCSPGDAAHFQNLNGGLGSLAEVASMSAVGSTPYTMMVGLGANGTAGVKATAGPTAIWPEILDGEGGPVAVDSSISPPRWYVNNGTGVSIHVCAQSSICTAADFGTTPVVSNADVGGDGLTMTIPAQFVLDPLDASQLLVGTCRVWRGRADGTGWTAANAVSPMLDGTRTNSYCGGNALIRSIAALALPGGGEVVYVGMYGALNGGATKPGHVFRATMNASGTWSAWTDLTPNPVTNDNMAMNAYGLDISSLFIDAHDPSGNTVYATVAGFLQASLVVRVVYQSTDGGAHWAYITSNLPSSPANEIVVDPQDANTAYLATDAGVFSTRNLSTCADAGSNCWSAYGTGLPQAPVVALSAAPASGLPNVLAAATYGRGVWQAPLLTAGTQLTTAVVDPTSLTFDSVPVGLTGGALTVTLTNAGGIALQPTAISISGDFSQTDNCLNASIDSAASCTIQVTFRPVQTGARTGQLTIGANISGGQIVVPLTGTGIKPGIVRLSPAAIDFGKVEAGKSSDPFPVTAENGGGSPVAITSVSISGPFVIASNACGAVSLNPNSDCAMTVRFEPATPGAANGTLTVVDEVGTQTVGLSGIGQASPTDTLSPTSLTFPDTIIGSRSSAETVSLSNSGDVPLTSIAASVTGPYEVSTDCTSQLTGQAKCSINVSFLPTASGVQTGTLTVHDLLRTQTVPLSGTGLLPPAFRVNPPTITFPAQTFGVASTPITLTVTNSGGAPMANVGFQISGQSASSFSMGTTTCGATLANGDSCTAQLIFTPAATGTLIASLTVSTSTINVVPATVALNGTGQSGAGLIAAPSQLTFAAQALGQPSAAQTVTISNTGGTNASGLAISISGPFSLTQNSCGTSLVAGANCTTGVVFSPTSKGMLSGALTASSTSVTTPATVALSGIGGLTGSVLLQPALVTFPTSGVGTTSTPVAITVTNQSASVALADLVFAASPGFTVASNSCGTTLAAGATCTVGVAFAPTTTGLQSGSLSLTSSVLSAAATVSLSGTGFDFTASASGSSSKTVVSGQSATYTLTLAPSSGLAAAFTFQCNSLPLYAACAFNPATASIAAGTTGTETVQVTTTQAKAALVQPPSFSGWRTLPLACGLLALPLFRRRRRGMLVLVVLLAFAVCGISSCSSSGGGSGGTTRAPTPTASTTPVGTYSIPVTVTSGGVQHSVTLTLVVD